MRDTRTMIQDDSIKAKSILKHIKGCKVADDNNNRYEVVDVKCFNGLVSFIGLKDADGVVKYASENCYMAMADVAWFMSLIKTYLHTLQMNNQLEMLSQREQLMEDIDAIITSQYLNDKIDEDDMEDLIRVLCDAVCKNFPTN